MQSNRLMVLPVCVFRPDFMGATHLMIPSLVELVDDAATATAALLSIFLPLLWKLCWAQFHQMISLFLWIFDVKLIRWKSKLYSLNWYSKISKINTNNSILSRINTLRNESRVNIFMFSRRFRQFRKYLKEWWSRTKIAVLNGKKTCGHKDHGLRWSRNIWWNWALFSIFYIEYYIVFQQKNQITCCGAPCTFSSGLLWHPQS